MENNLSSDQPRAGLSVQTGMLMGVGIGILLSLLCLALIAGSVWLTSANLTADCKIRGSSLSDILRAQTFAPGIFERPTWTESFSSSPERVTKTWLSSDLSAVSYFEYLVYNCGYQQTDIDSYYNDENFKTAIFQNYQDVKKTAECSKDDLQHFEFTGRYNNEDYLMYYWVKQDGNTRLLGFMMAFPAKEEVSLKTYSRRVYSALASCE